VQKKVAKILDNVLTSALSLWHTLTQNIVAMTHAQILPAKEVQEIIIKHRKVRYFAIKDDRETVYDWTKIYKEIHALRAGLGLNKVWVYMKKEFLLFEVGKNSPTVCLRPFPNPGDRTGSHIGSMLNRASARLIDGIPVLGGGEIKFLFYQDGSLDGFVFVQ
jgi:hypothetical protein